MVIRGVKVEEQHLFRAELFKLVLPHLVDVQARKTGDIAQPESPFVDQATQLGSRSAGIRRAQRLVTARRAGNCNVYRTSDRYEVCEHPLADKRHVARHYQGP